MLNSTLKREWKVPETAGEEGVGFSNFHCSVTILGNGRRLRGCQRAADFRWPRAVPSSWVFPSTSWRCGSTCIGRMREKGGRKVPRPGLLGVWVIVCFKYRSQLMEAASAESSRAIGVPVWSSVAGLWTACSAGAGEGACTGGAPPWLLKMLTKWIQHARLETRTKETCAVASVWVENSSAKRR